MDIARDEQVDITVAIVIAPGGPGAEPTATDAGFFGDIFKLAIPEVAVEDVSAIAGNEEVEFAVVVVIGDGDAHAPAEAREASLLGDVLEAAVGFLMVERDHRVSAFLVAVDGRAVDRDDVEASIIIAIEKASATAHGLDDVALFACRKVGSRQANGLGDVFEFWDWGKAGTVNFGLGEFCGRWKRNGGALRTERLRSRGT